MSKFKFLILVQFILIIGCTPKNEKISKDDNSVEKSMVETQTDSVSQIEPEKIDNEELSAKSIAFKESERYKRITEFNGVPVDSLKSFDKWNGEFVKDIGEFSYGIATFYTPDSSFLIFIEKTINNDTVPIDWFIIDGIKVPNLSYREAMMNNSVICTLNDERIVGLVDSITEDGSVIIYTAFGLDFEQEKFIQIDTVKTNCFEIGM